MNLAGKTPNGNEFIANPKRLWLIDSSHAILDGVNLGPAGALIGDYDWTADANERAAQVDEEYIKIVGKAPSLYQLGYYPHDLHFSVYARAAQGRYSDGLRAVERLTAQVIPGFDAMPDMVGPVVSGETVRLSKRRNRTSSREAFLASDTIELCQMQFGFPNTGIYSDNCPSTNCGPASHSHVK